MQSLGSHPSLPRLLLYSQLPERIQRPHIRPDQVWAAVSPTHSLCPEQLCHPPREQGELGSAECLPLFQGCSARMSSPAQTCLQGLSPCATSCLTGCTISPRAASHTPAATHVAQLLLPPPVLSHRGMLENPWAGMAPLFFYPGKPSLPKSYQGDGQLWGGSGGRTERESARRD